MQGRALKHNLDQKSTVSENLENSWSLFPSTSFSPSPSAIQLSLISPQKQCIFAVFDKHVYLLEQKRPIKVSLSITGPVGHRHNAEG